VGRAIRTDWRHAEDRIPNGQRPVSHLVEPARSPLDATLKCLLLRGEFIAAASKEGRELLVRQ
jgi:hypothetical protein